VFCYILNSLNQRTSVIKSNDKGINSSLLLLNRVKYLIRLTKHMLRSIETLLSSARTETSLELPSFGTLIRCAFSDL